MKALLSTGFGMTLQHLHTAAFSGDPIQNRYARPRGNIFLALYIGPRQQDRTPVARPFEILDFIALRPTAPVNAERRVQQAGDSARFQVHRDEFARIPEKIRVGWVGGRVQSVPCGGHFCRLDDRDQSLPVR